MKPPEEDFEARTPIWDSMPCLSMDTDVTRSYDFIARTCLESKYSFEELEKILFNEVLPYLKFNMFDLPAPEWVGFETHWVVERILKTNRFGKRKPWVIRKHTQKHWNAMVQGMGKTALNKASEATRYQLRRSRFFLLALGDREPSREGIAA